MSRPMPPLTSGVDDMADDWPFISYNPLEDPPLPQPSTRPTMRYRLAAFGVRWICLTLAYTSGTIAVCLLATGRA